MTKEARNLKFLFSIFSFYFLEKFVTPSCTLFAYKPSSILFPRGEGLITIKKFQFGDLARVRYVFNNFYLSRVSGKKEEKKIPRVTRLNIQLENPPTAHKSALYSNALRAPVIPRRVTLGKVESRYRVRTVTIS